MKMLFLEFLTCPLEAVLRIQTFSLDPDQDFFCSSADLDADLALNIDSYPVIAYKIRFNR
jgi:hypothetical protein